MCVNTRIIIIAANSSYGAHKRALNRELSWFNFVIGGNSAGLMG